MGREMGRKWESPFAAPFARLTSPCGLPEPAEGLSADGRTRSQDHGHFSACGFGGGGTVRVAALLAAVATAAVLAFPATGPAQQPAVKRPPGAVRPAPPLPQGEV